MKVFVVESGYDYESSRVEEVFDSAEKAAAYVEGRKLGTIKCDEVYGFDWIDWVEKELK